MNETKSENSNQENSEEPSQTDAPQQKLTLFQVIGSVFAAAFGVQSDKNRERDFTQAKPSTYIIAGIIFTALFVLTLAAIVTIVLGTAGS